MPVQVKSLVERIEDNAGLLAALVQKLLRINAYREELTRRRNRQIATMAAIHRADLEAEKEACAVDSVLEFLAHGGEMRRFPSAEDMGRLKQIVAGMADEALAGEQTSVLLTKGAQLLRTIPAQSIERG